MITRYKRHDIIIDDKNNFFVQQGNHILAAGYSLNDSPLEQAKNLIDAEFATPLLAEIRKLTPTKRELEE